MFNEFYWFDLANTHILEEAGYITGDGDFVIDQKAQKSAKKHNHDHFGAALLEVVRDVHLPQVDSCHELLANTKRPAKDSSVYTKQDLEVLRRGFQEEYIDPYNLVDETVKQTKDNITNYCQDPDQYVAPYTTLVTSSMMGKSRLMKEIARKLPSVYMCFRSDGSSGYPKPTPLLPDWIKAGVMSQIRDYQPTSDTDFTVPTFKFCIFLLVLIQELRRTVTKFLKDHTSRVSATDPYLWMWEIFAKPGSADDEKLCADFWESVVTAAKDKMKEGKILD